MNRLDGKGFHPTARPYRPHRKRERSKLMVTKNIPPTSWQLAMMRIDASVVGDDCYILGALIEADYLAFIEKKQKEPMCGWEICSGFTGDYSAIQADLSRPPPKQTIISEDNEFANNLIRKKETTPTCGLIQRLQKLIFIKLLIFVLPFMATAIMATSCHKEPYDVVIDWTWGDVPDKELVNQYENDRNVKTIILNILPSNATSFTPYMFHNACEHFKSDYFSGDHKTVGKGNIYVHRFNGAQLPDPYANNIEGMAKLDSIEWARMGYGIVRGRPQSR